MIENALDFEGLKYNNRKMKYYIKDEIEKEANRAKEIENNKVDKTTVASETSLGLVKSGGDISVNTSGNVYVNDNSHKHTLNNISDLLITKDELNVLSGISVNTQEINHLKNSTSNIQEQLNDKAPLDSPILTGIPEAPTAEIGNNTTQIATTEYVQNEINNLGEKASAKSIYVAKTINSSSWNNPKPDGIGTIYDGYVFTVPFHNANVGTERYGNYMSQITSVDGGEKSLLVNDGIYYLTDEGTTSKLGYSELVLGNNKWSNIDTNNSRDGNKYGAIRLYGVGYGTTGQTNSNMANEYVRITTMPLSSNRIIRLPDKDGTIALTTSNVASADIATKATQDGNGNVIANTYAQLNNPVFTNSLRVEEKTTGNLDCMEIKVIDGNNTLSYKMGLYCSATGNSSFAQGSSTIASGACSHSSGVGTKASGNCSFTGGRNTTAIGDSSFAIGYNTVATKDYQMVIGTYSNSDTIDDSVFVIGSGSGTYYNNRANSFRINFNGTTYSNGEYISSGADYAEYFEWLDGNLNNEDRRGYFVTLDGDKIRIANPNDFIIGVISGQPSVIGNGDEDWTGRYIVDEFGAYVYEDVEVSENIINQETGKQETITKTIKVIKTNPDYDSTKHYIQRKDRPEWDCVGLLGVLHVRDDGSCKINEYCKVADGGIATASDTGYRVIKRVSDNVVKVILK